MKIKTLKKKIRRLETRLQEGPTKLAKLKSKLEAIVKADAAKARKKLAARAAIAREAASGSAKTAEAKGRPIAKQATGGKAKKKLNLSPERRAQLADAMRARWAAKRAAEANPHGAPPNRDFTLGSAPQGY